jgi:UDP-N-acetylglucosamine--N-acetylmuramyl-(pentapeptide) pyrophosphoryl-undecaprenol N-acetylglucosamine transferase
MPNKHQLTICYVAGKSGGHIIPCLTLAKNWRNTHKNGNVLFISSNHPLDRTLTKNQYVTANYYLSLSDVPYKKIYRYPVFFWQFLTSCIRSIHILRKTHPIRVVSTGGIVAIPVILAAYVLRIPVELWELNVVPGRTISFLARFATTINICFSETQQYLPKNTCILVSYPTRYSANDKISREHAHTQLHLNQDRITLFIIGGSQGSASLSMIVKKLIEQYPDSAPQITCIHQTGDLDTTDWAAFYRIHHIPALVFAYRHDLAPCYNAADIIISRAGAGAIFEAAVFEKPCILVPLKTAHTAHQVDNAQAMAKQHPENFFHTSDVMAPEQLYVIIKLTNTQK